jgi:hypothetical protein
LRYGCMPIQSFTNAFVGRCFDFAQHDTNSATSPMLLAESLTAC